MEFQKEWLTDPEFKISISGVPGDDCAYCKLCDKNITVYNKGRIALKAHNRGTKHRNLVDQARRNRKNKNRPKPYFGILSSAGSQRQTSELSDTKINLSIVNNPVSSPNVPSHHPTKPSPSTSTSHHASASRRPSPPPLPRRKEWKFEVAVDDMISRHDSMIVGSCSDVLASLRRNPVEYDVTEYSNLKKILDDYEKQHRNLRSRIKKRITETMDQRWMKQDRDRTPVSPY